METKRIVFTKLNTAELLTEEVHMNDNAVCVKTAFSTISCGTEKANITGDANVAGQSEPCVSFPRYSGYSSSGVVCEVGKNVTGFSVGDRVAMYWSSHTQYNVLPPTNLIKLGEKNTFREGALAHIATFPLAAIRKTRLEFGEPCLVMGLGILGQLAVQLAKAAGACPVVAADPVESRRKLAIEYGADYAFDPTEPDFAEKVKKVTGGGASVCVEVTGVGAGLDSALDCMRRHGRISLLGCTRDKNFTIDYYRKVHCPGITLIGAHTNARPQVESYPGYFTHNDDNAAVLKMCEYGRINIERMVAETHSPKECFDVYTRLVNDKNFPVCVQFDWSLLDK